MRTGSFVIGYHGCDEKIGRELLLGNAHILVSNNPCDWLGRGAYFWEDDAQRALEWATFIKNHAQNFHHKVEKPCVVGAVLNLKNVLDLTDSGSLEIVRSAAEELRELSLDRGYKLPKNESSHQGDDDLTKRFLDCAVINYLHDLRANAKLPHFDSVRGVFTEGKPLFPGSKIMVKTHIQISVLNPATSVVGYFKPRRTE